MMILTVGNNEIYAEYLQEQEKQEVEIPANEEKNIAHLKSCKMLNSVFVAVKNRYFVLQHERYNVIKNKKKKGAGL